MLQDEPRGITFQPDIYPVVLSHLPAQRTARILDVGAGEGYFCKLAAARGYHIEGCDFQPQLFKLSGVPFHQADLNHHIPVPDESFDCVVAIEVIEHLENHSQFMRELLRVTKKGGSIILTTPNVTSIPARWYFFLYGYSDCARRPLDPTSAEYFLQHINPISLPEILFLSERFGGELEELTTNRRRRSAWLPLLVLYPVFAVALRIKLLRRKYAAWHSLYRRHIRWMLDPINLLGRITIAVVRRRG